MQLIEVPAKTGYVWFRQGIWLFRKNPLAFLTLFFTYLLVMTLASQIPVIGGVLPLVFIPGVAVGFMAACRNTIAGKPVFPTILVDGFHSYGPVVAKRLLVLGVLYVVAMALVLAGSALADGGMLLKVMLGDGHHGPGRDRQQQYPAGGDRRVRVLHSGRDDFLVLADSYRVARRAARQGDVLQRRQLLAQSRRVHRVRCVVVRGGDDGLVRPDRADAGAGRGRLRVRGSDARHDDRHDHAVLLVLRDLSRLLRRANARSAGSADHAGGLSTG